MTDLILGLSHREINRPVKTSDAIFDAIKEAGIDTVYMVAGGGAMHLVDSLGRSGLQYVACLHEQGAGYAAIGHAMITGKVGVCLVTSGPGATNAVTACAAAWVDSVPVLFISGQAPSYELADGQRSRGPQEIDIMSIVDGITKAAQQPTSGKNTVIAIRQFLKLCGEGRPGPCWLSVPLDVQAEVVNV
jgi:acetolactate synthase-1/2/3 large subunit